MAEQGARGPCSRGPLNLLKLQAKMALLPGFRKQGQAWTRPVDAALDVADPGLSPAQALHPHSEEFGMRQGKLQVSVRCGIGNRWPATVCSRPHRSVRGPKTKASALPCGFRTFCARWSGDIVHLLRALQGHARHRSQPFSCPWHRAGAGSPAGPERALRGGLAHYMA